MAKPDGNDDKPDNDPRPGPYHYAAACLIGLPVLVYLVLLPCLPIRPERRLGAVEVVLLFLTAVAVAVVLRPALLAAFFKHVQKVRWGSFELEVKKLNERVDRQKAELNDVRFFLTLLLDDKQREHLLKLYEDEPYWRTPRKELVSELRKLREMRYVKQLDGHRIAEANEPDAGHPERKRDLKKIVRLTEQGEEYVKRLKDTEEDAPAADPE